jgi:hypothetical protein
MQSEVCNSQNQSKTLNLLGAKITHPAEKKLGEFQHEECEKYLYEKEKTMMTYRKPMEDSEEK